MVQAEDPAAGNGSQSGTAASGHRRFLGWAFENRLVREAGYCGADHRSCPEQPELLKGPASDNTAVAVLRAGLTEVFVTGMLIK